MKVFKFGGASINSLDKINNTAEIIKNYQGEELLIVISAIGKTTNALEKVTDSFFNSDKEKALKDFETIKDMHNQFAQTLLVNTLEETDKRLIDLYTEVEWLLHDRPVRNYDYYYDQIVCIGELLSTTIISSFLIEIGIDNVWIDVRDILRTDNIFRQANIDFDYSIESTKQYIKPLLHQHKIVITQGFIGSTDENESTTLGREGSDYTAAVFSNLLDAESLTIWKDVPGIMSADPKKIHSAVCLPTLDYNEVVEMAYYGAQVIHPKTIKPVQNKHIPLYVKNFEDISIPGTIIHTGYVSSLPPIIVLKDQQVLMKIHSKDFSFFGKENMIKIYQMLSDTNLSPNLFQTGAITVILSIDDKPENIESFALMASAIFDIEIERGFTLLTIRHFNDEIREKMLEGKTISLLQQTKETIQAVYK